MHPYLPHLLADLEAIIQQPPPAAFYEVPPHLHDMPWVAELAQSPFTSLEEVTGIAFETIPPFFEFPQEDWALLADAFRRLLEALNIAIVDLPEDYPDDAFIDLIQTHWDDEIHYLPLSGYDWECCTGDNETCPYGDGCMTCGPQAPDIDDEIIPEAFPGGLFNDDGSCIDPMSVSIPKLCLRCKQYLSDDWEDELLCTLNRNDQKNSDSFECGAFEENNINDEP